MNLALDTIRYNVSGPSLDTMDTNLTSRTVSRTVWHKPPESGDARAGRAPRAPLGPTSPWEAPGVRVGVAVGLRGVLEPGAVSVVSLVVVNL